MTCMQDVDFQDPQWYLKGRLYRKTFLSQHSLNYISRAPLHLAHDSTTNITKKKLDSLKKRGFKITRGKFTKEEDKRIRKNWRRLIRFFPCLNEPMSVFAKNLVRCKLTNRIIILKKTRGHKEPQVNQNFRWCKGMHRLAYKLDDRLICDVYNRAKKLIHESSFNITCLEELPKDRLEYIRKRLKAGRVSIPYLAAKEDINPQVLHHLLRYPKRETGSFRWSSEDDSFLSLSLSKQFEDVDLRMVPTYKIDWKRAAADMSECGYSLRPDQLYKRWTKLNAPMVGLRNKSWEEVKEAIKGHCDTEEISAC